MAAEQSSGALMKWGVIIAAAIIVIRIVLEQLGAPEPVNKIFGVVWMYFIMPILFGMVAAARSESRPFRALLKNLFFFALYTRLMVMVTYMLGFFFNWRAQRFSEPFQRYGSGQLNPFVAYLAIPARNAVIWILFALVIGIILGGITLWLRRKPLS